MKMKRIITFMGRFHRDSPRLWALSIFPAVLILTVIGLPIAFVVSVGKDIPRIWSNFYGDVRGCICDSWKDDSKLVAISWKVIWCALHGKNWFDKSETEK